MEDCRGHSFTARRSNGGRHGIFRMCSSESWNVTSGRIMQRRVHGEYAQLWRMVVLLKIVHELCETRTGRFRLRRTLHRKTQIKRTRSDYFSSVTYRCYRFVNRKVFCTPILRRCRSFVRRMCFTSTCPSIPRYVCTTAGISF